MRHVHFTFQGNAYFYRKEYWYQNQTIMVISSSFFIDLFIFLIKGTYGVKLLFLTKIIVREKNKNKKNNSKKHWIVFFFFKRRVCFINDEFVPELVTLLLFTGNQQNKHFSISFQEPRKGSHYLSSISWTNKRSFPSVLAYCCWAFLWFVA